MKKYVITTLSDYISFTAKLNRDSDELWFRGHSSATYRLIPSVLRETVPLTDWKGDPVKKGQVLTSGGGHVTGLNAEKMFYEFKSKALPFLDREPANNFEWMFLMQHYGLPTRLLDWTTNALVALFFAIESEPSSDEKKSYQLSPADQFLNVDECCPDGAAIFIMSPSFLNENATVSKEVPYLSEEHKEWDHYFEPMEKDQVNFLPVAVRASHIDKRIASQSGNFTLHGSSIHPIDYYEPIRESLVKIFIPYEAVSEMLSDLTSVGITESFIYPGLDSLAKDIKRKEENRFKKYNESNS